MNKEQIAFIIFFIMITAGVGLESLLARLHDTFSRARHKTNRFHFSRYFFLLVFPVIATIFAYYDTGISVAYIFFGFALVGLFLEWMIGFSYEQVVGQKLWTYHRYAITGYTSWLTLPLWGFAGVLFLLGVRAVDVLQ